MTNHHFSPATFTFLQNLQANNNRAWFDLYRQDYEVAVRTPALAFIESMADDLSKISPHFRAIAKKVGGSLMRVHRDVRFGHDKRPYKTNVGIQFRHARGKDVHAPGFYVHLEPKECFIGVGIWRPDATALDKIRTAIADNGAAWLKASCDKKLFKDFEFAGDALKNAPRGYAKDHPLIEDLKRKDFIAIKNFPQTLVTSDRFQPEVVKSFRAVLPLMTFLCQALELPI